MNFTIIGGDLRSVKICKILSKQGNNIYTYALENAEEINEHKDIKVCDTLEEAIEKSENIILPTPFSKDGQFVHTVYTNNKLNIDEVLSKIKKEQKIFVGAIQNNIKEKYKDLQIIDLMKLEEVAVLNTIATAEGTIEIAIRETQKNIQGSKILVLGFGRVAKVVAQKFKALDAKVTCAARKQEDFAWIETLGLEYTNINQLNEEIGKYDIIINTVPELILKEEQLKNVQKQTLLIDLASKPGGIDFEVAKKLELKCIWALALPGKVAPISTAEILVKSILKNI
ncbi:MAG: dipicolinate synthase subunit DpsA [Clostridia bacterium]|nr:dipicolinate synthase subunit DpsA [Clostridia bacterium]